MKKIFALLIALMLILSFAACAQEETVITEEDLALYEEMLVNFGGTRKFDGSIVVSRKGSFYDFSEGIEDCSAMEPNSYYTWVASRTENSDKVKVTPAGFESEVYAYSADFFEGEVSAYFGVSAEYLHGSEYYCSEPGCYYSDGVSSSEEYTYVEYVSAEKSDDLVTIHLTLTNTNGTTNHSLTVKLLPEGGYNYVSYLPE
ncbi:MAG: hypothetical protein IJO22_02015 [Oscillospiraceae bacterium]|nr:hypothetical protein [Oscillospiraceae bacterium]